MALLGSGGSGVMTAAELLLRGAAKAGYYALLTKSFGPQIRGGEAAAFIVISNAPVDAQADRFDLVVAIDWLNADRFAGEIPLDADSLVVSPAPTADVPAALAAAGCRTAAIDLAAIAKQKKGVRANVIALGAVAAAIGLPTAVVETAAEQRLAGKDADAVANGLRALALGAEAAKDLPATPKLGRPPARQGDPWVISGNQGIGLGALRGGVRFVAAYPITPATEILEWMAPRIQKLGGSLAQAEDELASINMIIGASYAGTPALTATSGPGLALMTESIGLAVAAEVPLVVVDVMRCGPSTGIPTRSEQTDLNLAVYGLHGDAPHIVTAPVSIRDCVFTAQWSVHLAETMQVPAIVLSDQSLGQALTAVDAPSGTSFPTDREIADKLNGGYQRYAVTESGISPMALPGTAGGQYTADGLEHAVDGLPSSAAADHAQQLDKRLRKVVGFDYGEHWAETTGNGDAAVITWGSSVGPVRAAVRRLDPQATRLRVIALRLLAPAQPDLLAAALDGVERTIVVEQSHGAQLHAYLRAHYGLTPDADSLASPGPVPIRPDMLHRDLEAWLQ